MKAAVVRNFGQPLSIDEVPVPRPADGQVLVKVETSGLCRTDVHAARGDWPIKPALPFVPGHEGVGTVVELGRGVRNMGEGDRVAVPWLGWACGACELCTSGWETLCGAARFTGYTVNGGFAEYVVIDAAFAVPVPAALDPLDAAPLSCAGVTTYKSVKVSGARSSDLVAIFGMGDLGQLALEYTKVTGATVAAVDVVARKLEAAHRLGADFIMDGSVEDPAAALQAMGGADIAIVALATPTTYELAFRSLRPDGSLVGVGAPKDNSMRLPIFQTVRQGVKVIGPQVGTRADLAETFELHVAGHTTIVRTARALEQVNEAMAEVDAGVGEGRVVFDLRT